VRSAASPTPLAPSEHTPQQARLVTDAPRFDLRPLLEQLAVAGYGNEAVLFEGATEGGGTGLVKSLRFIKAPMPAAIITLHMGLMGDAGLLPSYFTWVIEHSPEPARFLDFIRFFEHQLIDNMFHATHPDWARCPPKSGGSRLAQDTASLLGDTPQFLKTILRIARPSTPATLHWLAQLCFPEFGVRVRRHAFKAATGAYACRLGISCLDGTGILGREYVSALGGYTLDLYTDDEKDLSGREQAGVAVARLRGRLLDLLAPYNLALTVRLHVRWHSSFARVDSPSDPNPSFLGYERLGGEKDERHATVIYSGITGRDWGPWKEVA
jgi:hypothetical protein